ncbi:hypothetical protein Cch01nite_43100 [Cellulomonas chitinilytica]|uniref:Uncharacterized protein n=1 Tax=Cellulomonas chitinilytica TaxID=398759 RepID=A0A919U3S6_9CELL|nr:hypothetical protein Cch01nite_43100 [Cellulomonas chitinilytica]
MTLPGVWESRPDGASTAEFDVGGTGYFTNFPLWSGGTCDPDRVVPYTGEFRWTAIDGYFRVDAPNGPMLFQPPGHFGQPDWQRLVISLCGEQTPDEALLVYDGGPDWGPEPTHQSS